MKLTFRHGIHPDDKKELTKNCAFENLPVPEILHIPLTQHIGKPCIPCVVKGDKVKAGTVIGKTDGLGALIHSSVSGEVLGFELRELANGKKANHIVIKNDYLYEEEIFPPLDNPTADEIKLRVKEAGIVGMGGATFPTEVKLSTKAVIKTLIINGSECEPYITTDHRMMIEFPSLVIEGIGYIKKALNAERVLIGIEDNKPDAIEAMKNAVTDINMGVFPLKSKYPQGGEKQLIYALTKHKVPNKGLPSDLGIIVLNISTSFAIYEAVKLGKASYSRYMTISGHGIKNPKNIFVRNGTLFSDILDYVGVNENYVKAVSGGPMMGLSIDNFTVAAAKGNTALLLLNENEIRAVLPSPCINCGRCASVCPIGLLPMKTDAFILRNKIKEAKEFFPESCIECGCCSYVCPAKRPLVQSQRLAKKLIREGK